MTGLRGFGRKSLRRLRRVVGAPGPWFVHHAGYRIGLPGVSVDPLRAHRILAFLLDEGWGFDAMGISLAQCARREDEQLQALLWPGCLGGLVDRCVDQQEGPVGQFGGGTRIVAPGAASLDDRLTAIRNQLPQVAKSSTKTSRS